MSRAALIDFAVWRDALERPVSEASKLTEAALTVLNTVLVRGAQRAGVDPTWAMLALFIGIIRSLRSSAVSRAEVLELVGRVYDLLDPKEGS